MMFRATPSWASSTRMGVAELVGRTPPAHTRLDGEAVKLEPHTGA